MDDNNNTGRVGTIDGVRNCVDNCLSDGYLSGNKGDTVGMNGEEHSGNVGDEKMKLGFDIEPNAGAGDQPDDGTDCQFRCGVCLQHKPKGDKHIGKSKKWGKVKSEYGWIHSSKVRYTCKTVSRGLSFARLEDERSDSRLPGLSANSKGIKGLTDDISGQRAENEMESL